MNEETGSERKSGWRWIIRGIVLLVVITVIAGLTTPMVMRCHVDPLSHEWGTLHSLRFQLVEYASCNDGHFPAQLDDLDLPHRGGEAPKFRDFRTGKRMDWKYFAGFGWQDRGDTIVVAAPFAFSKKDGTFRALDDPSRMILTLDGRILILAEKEYRECIAAQSTGAWQATPPVSSRDPWRFLDAPVWNELAPPDRSVDRPKPVMDIPLLIRQMELGQGRIRRDAADTLGELDNPPPEFATALLQALGDSEAAYSAAMWLSKISLDDAGIIPQIVETMRSGDGKAEYWAAVALCKIGLDRAPEAVPLMAAALIRSGDDIQITAAKALAGLGPTASAAVPELIGVLSEGDSWAVKCAVIALGRIGPQAHAAIPALANRFESAGDYRIDVARALWSIDPWQAPHLIRFLIDVVASQRNPSGPNQPMGHSFFSAIELLGQMGPTASAAIPVLKDQLRGGARTEAAWSLWRIDPTLLKPMTVIIAGALVDDGSPYDDRFAEKRGSGNRRVEYYSGLEACGMLWQMHPERRDDLRQVLAHLLRARHQEKGLYRFRGSARCAIPVLEELLHESMEDDMRRITRIVLQEIRTTDPGEW